MNLKFATASLLISTSFAKDSPAQPHRIAFDALIADPLHTENGSILIDSLSNDGILSVTGIPGFGKTKRTLMSHLHACMIDQGDELKQETLQDGTVRRTLATVTLPGSGAQPMSISNSESCERFSEHLDSFRASVDEATNAFADRLSFEMGSSLPQPLMTTADGSHDFNDIKEVVAAGEHLEHFHSYQKSKMQTSVRYDKETIELHADQGFFISFCPGLMVSNNEDKAQELSVSEGFYVEDSEGHRSLLQFDAEDDLVFMMGDGVNQYINNRLDTSGSSQNKRLRATPHAVSLTAHDDSIARVWYGRMVLPPKEALSSVAGQTYGDARKQTIESAQGGIPSGVGCSSPHMESVLTGRNLAGADDCADDELFCWFRCMPLADQNLTVTTCAEQNLQLQCASPRDQVVPDGKQHGDFYPSCTNSTQNHTNYPEIPGQDETCAGDWEAFYMDGTFDHMADLTTAENDGAFLSWSVTGETVKARLAFNNVHGWIGLGFADPNGYHNGMNGGEVFLAIPGGDYSPVTGLDISKEPSVQTYKIDPDNTAFRHWQTAVADSVATFETTPCFTAISFETDNINGKAFNTTGSDEIIWAANGADHFMGYHGRNRGRYTIEWSTGKVSQKGSNDSEDHDNHDDHDDHDDNHGHNHSGDSSSRRINLPLFSASLTLTSLAYLFI